MDKLTLAQLKGLAKNPNTPTDMLLALLNSGEHDLQFNVLRNPHVPDQVWNAAVTHPDQHVRNMVAKNRHAPPEHRARLATDPDQQVRVALTEQRRTPPETRRALCADEDPLVRATAIKGWPNPPEDVTDRLLTDPAPSVRLAVSMRPELTEEQRAAIDFHVGPKDFVRPPDWLWDRLDDLETMRRCATSAHLGLRRTAAYSPHLPADLVEFLTEHHPSPPPALPPEVMTTLLSQAGLH
ncbi:hypothetical protein AB0L06_32005 [Spirillospora sp. NPDC052269]